jgi:hypothetical protein
LGQLAQEFIAFIRAWIVPKRLDELLLSREQFCNGRHRVASR